jgi:hypothetical protein
MVRIENPFFLKDSNYIRIATGAEMIAEKPFDLPSKAFCEANYLRLLGERCHSQIAKLLEDVFANGLEKRPVPPMAGDGYVHVRTFEAVENCARDYLAVLFDSQACPWGTKTET